MPSDHEYDDDEEEAEGPRSSFGTYLAEGDTLFKQSEYKKSLESYSLALELQPNDKTCLVARSKCYLKLGDPQKALLDAEAALEENKEFNKGLYRKAEALYSMGDFEYALMYYHRGHKLRPELNEFRLGIQKAQEAIDNSIGSAAKIKLENKGDLSFFTKQDELGMKKRTTGGGMAGYLKPTPVLKIKPAANRNKEVKPPTASKKTVKQLLGELYADKEYLEHLMSEDDFIKNNPDGPIFDLVKGGLNYLDTRTEFWRQQKPLYARKTNETKGFHLKKGRKTKKSVAKYILQQLEAVDQALTQGNPERCIRLAEPLLKAVDNINEKELPNKTEIIANLNSCIGSAFLDMSQLPKALTHHKRDLALSKASNHEDGISRSLDNIGRVYAKMEKYDLAISCWMDKITLIASALEGAWLYHEIGRCHLEKASYGDALLFGGKSLMAARECEDEMWQLNAHVLIAQTHAQRGNTHESVEAFEQALLVSQSLGDESAEAAITKAMLDVVSKDPHYKKRQTEREEADNEESAAEQRPEYLSEDTEVSKRSPSSQSRSPSPQSRSASELSNRSRKSNRSRSPQSDGNRSPEHQSEMSDRNDTAQSNRDTDTAATSNDESSLRQDEQTPSGRSATSHQSSVKEPSENEEEDEKGQRRLRREANNEEKEDDKIAGEEERKESLGENSENFDVQDSTSTGGVLSDSVDFYGTKDEAEKPELATDVSEDQSEAEFPPTDPQTQHSKADEDKEKDNTPIETSKNETGDLPNEINEKKETCETTDNNLQGEANETTGNNLQNEANETTDSNLQNDVNGSTEKNGLSGAENKANETTPDNNLQNEANEKTDNLLSEANETSDSNLPNEANESRDIRSQTEAKIPTLPREMQIITPGNVSDDPNTTGEQPERKAGDDFVKKGTSGSLKKTAVEETDNREAAGSSNEDQGDNKPIDESARSDSNSTKTDKPDDESLRREMGKSVPIREIIL